MESSVLIGLLGDSSKYSKVKYTFPNENDLDDKKYWFSTKAIFEYLKKNNIKINKVILIGPDNEVVKKSLNEGWSEEDKKRDNRIYPKESILSLFPEEVEVEPFLLDENKYGELDFLFEEFVNKIEIETHGEYIYLDLTHGYRHVPIVFLLGIQKLMLTKEDINFNGIYYAGKQNYSEGEYEVIDLTPMLDMLNALGYIRDFKLRVAPESVSILMKKDRYFYGSKDRLKEKMNSFKNSLYLILNGAVDEDTIDMVESKIKDIKKILKKNSLSIHERILGDEIISAGEYIISSLKEKEKIWMRQLELAKILLERRLEIRTSLSLIRESLISWIIEEGLNKDAFVSENRSLVSERKKEYSYLWEYVVKRVLFGKYSGIIEKRNAYAHVLTDDKLKNEVSNKIIKEIENLKKSIEELLEDMTNNEKISCLKIAIDKKDLLIDIINNSEAEKEKISNEIKEVLKCK